MVVMAFDGSCDFLSCAIVNTDLSSTVYQLLDVEEYRDLEIKLGITYAANFCMCRDS